MKREELKAIIGQWARARKRRGDSRWEIERQFLRMIPYLPGRNLITAEELQKRLAKGLPSIKTIEKASSWRERDERRMAKGY